MTPSDRRTGLVLQPNCAPGSGSGHLRRSLVLGDAWQRAGGGRSAFDLVGEVDPTLLQVLTASDIPVDRDVAPAWTVLDSYSAPRPAVQDLVIVDDFRQRSDHGSAFVLDQNFGADRSLYPEADRALLGPTYALLRPEFALAELAAASRRGCRRRRDLAWWHPVPEAARQRCRHRARSAPSGDASCTGRQSDRAGKPLVDSCLAIAASGSTVWELLCCGVPTILLSVAENQNLVRTHLVDADYCWRAEVDSLAARIERSQVIQSLVSHERRVVPCWSMGSARTESSLNSGRWMSRCVAATMGDADRLLAWANDPITRSNSFNPDRIDPESHVSWLRRVVDDENSMLLIAEYGDQPIGQMRFDEEEGQVLVSVGLAVEARGRSLGAPLILAGVRAARTRWPTLSMVARIKVDNTASIRAFRVGGFSHARPDEGDGVIELRYS